jgi:hypothetical protein
MIYHVCEMLGDRRGYSHLKGKLQIALSGGIVSEEAVGLSSDRLLTMMFMKLLSESLYIYTFSRRPYVEKR